MTDAGSDENTGYSGSAACTITAGYPETWYPPGNLYNCDNCDDMMTAGSLRSGPAAGR